MRRILLPLFLLAGCATGPTLQSRMAAYTGANEQTLVHDLGVPDKQITVDGVQYLDYTRGHAEIEPDVADIAPAPFFPGGFYGGGFYGGGFGGGFIGDPFPRQVLDYTCDVTFTLRDDRVSEFSMRGNDCG